MQRQTLWLEEEGTEDDFVGRRGGTGQAIGHIGKNSLKGSRDRREWDQFDLKDLSLKRYVSKGYPI